MSVKRDRPEHRAPGELQTPDGKTVRVKLPDGLVPPGEMNTSTRKRPRPEEPPDPRPSFLRDIPPFGGA